uniref:Uncharacterized protein n=1 Tax=viral metagenome TaxID=1070528 RepID=A0A6M3KYK5_9ZZZZ
MDPRYMILALRAGETRPWKARSARTIREARSIAYRLARAMRCGGNTARPMWCEGRSWHPHPDAPGRAPVGGYDAGLGGGTVIYL